MEKNKTLVTAATGNVGTPLVKALQRKGVPFTAATRHEQKAKEKLGADLDTVYFDFSARESFPDALRGVDTLFLCGPSATPGAQEMILPLIDEAQKQEVKHIVFIASYPKVMEAIEKTGISYTFIKANFFMQNFEIYQVEDIKNRNQIFMPVGDGKAPFIHTRDIGEVAAEVLERPEAFESKTLYITGPKAMDHFEAAQVFSKVLARTIIFKNPDDEVYREEMKKRGFTKVYIDAMIAVFGKIKKGQVAQTTNTVEEILERKPLTLEDYVKEKRELFE